MVWQTKKFGKIANILPKQMVNTFTGNPPVQAKTIVEKHYIGLWIKASGIIESVDLMSDYTTFNFRDNDGVYISANFFKPISSEVSLLDKGNQINLIGQVFNVAEEIVVLDYCILSTENKIGKPQGKKTKGKWWENSWVQGIGLVAAILGIISFFIFKK